MFPAGDKWDYNIRIGLKMATPSEILTSVRPGLVVIRVRDPKRLHDLQQSPIQGHLQTLAKQR